MPDLPPTATSSSNTPPTGTRFDARALRTLAHPLRSRLVSALRVSGPATATGLARDLGTNSGATSYHLRRLESVGLVTDTGEGQGKCRLWRASTENHQHRPSDVTGDDDAETALGWLSRDYSRHLGEQFERWLDAEHRWPVTWRDSCGMSDAYVIATPEQLRAMSAEIDAVRSRYRRIGQGSPEARRVAVYTVTYPLDLDRAPRREDRS
ncbi:MAG: ArsR/SmtB family transcription factor [Dermatophilaceae bacterium]